MERRDGEVVCSEEKKKLVRCWGPPFKSKVTGHREKGWPQRNYETDSTEIKSLRSGGNALIQAFESLNGECGEWKIKGGPLLKEDFKEQARKNRLATGEFNK